MTTSGLLHGAYFCGHAEPIEWVDIEWSGLVVTVASDAMKAACGDRPSIRLPVTYSEQVQILRHLGCVSPTKALADALYASATAKLHAVGLVRTAEDSKRMASVDFTLRFHDAIEKQLLDAPAQNLRFGAWKLWILHPRIVELGAVNYGFYSPSGSVIQTVGARHDASHFDYSQLVQPVRRYARTHDGTQVDLLTVFEREGIPARYLDAYT